MTDDTELFSELSAEGPLSSHGRDKLRELLRSERCVALITSWKTRRAVVVASARDRDKIIRDRFRYLRDCEGLKVNAARQRLYDEGHETEDVDRVLEKGIRKYARKNSRIL